MENTEARIKTLCDQVQWLVYENVTRSLFKADRLMFALHFAKGTRPQLFKENVRSLKISNLPIILTFAHNNYTNLSTPQISQSEQKR